MSIRPIEIVLVLSMVIILVALAALVFWAVRQGNSGSQGTLRKPGPTAKEIADERYARGEISREEYQRSGEDESDAHQVV